MRPAHRVAAGLGERWRGLPGNLRGVVLILLASLAFTLEVVAVRLLDGAVSITQIVLLRAIAQLVWVVPSGIAIGPAVFRTTRPGLMAVRGIGSVMGWGLYYYAYAVLPLGLATVLSFSSVLYTTLVAGPILGERVGWQRWTATLVGFGGVIVAMRPGEGGDLPAMLAALGSALIGSAIVLTTKQLARSEPTSTIMLYIGIVTTLGALGPAIWAWQPIPPECLPVLIFMGAIGPAGMWLMINGLRAGDASALGPVSYTRLVFSAAFGAALFNEPIDAPTLAGAALIVGSAVVIARWEVRSKSRP